MQRLKFTFISSILLSILTLPGCLPGVYKIDIQQGNIITQDMVNQLRPGMTKAQVKFLMGSPMILDPFHADRWDYIYSIQPGGGKLYQENVVLLFNKNAQLIGLSGDFLPGVSRDEAILGEHSHAEGGDVTTDSIPEGSLEQQIQHDVDSAEPVPVPIPDTIKHE